MSPLTTETSTYKEKSTLVMNKRQKEAPNNLEHETYSQATDIALQVLTQLYDLVGSQLLYDILLPFTYGLQRHPRRS